MIKRFLIACLFLLITNLSYAAPDNFFANCLTGGTTGCLDAIDITNDGIDNGDGAYVKTTTAVYLFNYNSTSGAAESSPDVIAPDNDGGVGYAGNGRWVLVDIFLATANIDNVQVKTTSGDFVIKNQAGSTIATFEDGQTAKLLSGGSINEFSTDGTLAGDSDSAVPTEKAVKTYVDANVVNLGLVNRSLFAKSAASTITIDAGVYHHTGTSNQLVYWGSQITFVLESGGSNAFSDDFGADGWHYIYLDDSAIVTQGTNLLDADCFLNETTAPTYSQSKHGWYNGDDRAIFAVYETGGAILEFFHDGGNCLLFADQITDLSVTDIDTSWTDVALSIPSFCTKAIITLLEEVLGDTVAYWRTNGQSGTTGHTAGKLEAGVTSKSTDTFTVITDTSQVIEVKMSASNGSTLAIYTHGWYFPAGM